LYYKGENTIDVRERFHQQYLSPHMIIVIIQSFQEGNYILYFPVFHKNSGKITFALNIAIALWYGSQRVQFLP